MRFAIEDGTPQANWPVVALRCCFCRRPAVHMALGFTLCDDGAEVGGLNCIDRAREMFRLNVRVALRD